MSDLLEGLPTREDLFKEVEKKSFERMRELSEKIVNTIVDFEFEENSIYRRDSKLVNNISEKIAQRFFLENYDKIVAKIDIDRLAKMVELETIKGRKQ